MGLQLLPIIIEHTIDERSPLCGHTFDTLTEVGGLFLDLQSVLQSLDREVKCERPLQVDAEIVVTFEGTTGKPRTFSIDHYRL